MKRQRRSLTPFFAALLVILTLTAPSFAATYVVQSGDSLFKIAKRTGLSVQDLKTYNQMETPVIYPGQVLRLPVHTVQRGESLYLIAKKYGTTVEALQKANNLQGSYIEAGQTLRLPLINRSSTTSPVSRSEPYGSYTYLVRSGDTLFLIAKRYGISLTALRQANNIWNDYLEPGQRLIIPKAATPSRGGSTNHSSNISLSQAEIDLLARLVQAEAGGESYTGKVAVAATVLNRLEDPRYPKTVSGIIYQVVDGKYYQYSPVLDGRINQPATPEAYRAVYDALAGWDPSKGANGFYNPSKTTNRWVQNRPVTTVIGNHVFFKY